MRKYNIIYADPPWQYRDRKKIRKDGKTAKRGIGAGGHYSLMSIDDIAALPVQNIAAENCALFLWTTGPLMDRGIDVLKSWGFNFVGIGFNWLKTYPNGKPFFGVGYYTKSNTELCLLGIRGKIKPASNKVSEVVTTLHPRYDKIQRPHSFKPHIFRSKIVELFGDVLRIELFARVQAPGWDATGLELDGVDIRDFLKRQEGQQTLWQIAS